MAAREESCEPPSCFHPAVPRAGLCLLMVCATFQVRDGPWEILILICSLERRKKAERGGRGEGRKERKRREEGGGEREKKRRR